MGNIVPKPVCDKTSISGHNNHLSYGCACMQGYRVYMEDRYTCIINLPEPLHSWSFFCLCDGHNGSLVAEEGSKKLLNCILNTTEFQTLKLDFDGNPCNKASVVDGIRRGFLHCEEYLRNMPEIRNGEDESGSTVTCVFVTPGFYIFANCGDSRTILINNGQCIFSTQDHKPDLMSEKQRIINAGGSVLMGRINGCLGVSRGLGDFTYKKQKNVTSELKQLVSPDPEITFWRRDNESSICPTSVLDDNVDDYSQPSHNIDTIVLATDGLWDELTNEDVAHYLYNRMIRIDSLEAIATQLIDYAFYEGSHDNISVIIIYFSNHIKINKALSITETILNKDLEDLVYEILERHNPNSIPVKDILSEIENMKLANIPPGGLVTKQYLIEKYVENYKNKPMSHTLEVVQRRNQMIYSD